MLHVYMGSDASLSLHPALNKSTACYALWLVQISKMHCSEFVQPNILEFWQIMHR
jgi:hypothetical protein